LRSKAIRIGRREEVREEKRERKRYSGSREDYEVLTEIIRRAQVEYNKE
jgi:hypothetical protein